jgi:hypothetical protein
MTSAPPTDVSLTLDDRLFELRREVQRSLVRVVVLAHLAVVVGALVIIVVAVGWPSVAIVLATVLGAEAVVGSVLWLSSCTGPLNWRYVSRYLDHQPSWEPVARTAPPDDVRAAAAELGRFAMRPVVPLRDTAFDDVAGGDVHDDVYDMFANPNRTVLAVRSRSTASLALMSRLSDGRVLHTDAATLLAGDRILANTAPNAGIESVVHAHRDQLAELAAQGLRPVAATLAIWAEVQECERQAYAMLGPVLASYCHLGGTRGPRVAVRPCQPAVARGTDGYRRAPWRPASPRSSSTPVTSGASLAGGPVPSAG